MWCALKRYYDLISIILNSSLLSGSHLRLGLDQDLFLSCHTGKDALLCAMQRKFFNIPVSFQRAGNALHGEGLIKNNELCGLSLWQPSQLVITMNLITTELYLQKFKTSFSLNTNVYLQLLTQSWGRSWMSWEEGNVPIPPPERLISLSVHKNNKP